MKVSVLRIAALSVAVLALGSCSVTRHGTLIRIPGGPIMITTVTIEKESATVSASHPDTGEILTGTLRVVDRERSEGEGPNIPGDMGGGSASPMGIPPNQPSAATPQIVTFSGILSGDQGTELQCRLEVEKRVLIRGDGVCREPGAPADAPFYRLRF